MKLPSTLRTSTRYLLISGAELSLLKDYLLDTLGIVNYAKTNPQIIRKGNISLLCVSNCMLNEVKAALVLYPKEIKLVKVSATINGAVN